MADSRMGACCVHEWCWLVVVRVLVLYAYIRVRILAVREDARSQGSDGGVAGTGRVLVILPVLVLAPTRSPLMACMAWMVLDPAMCPARTRQ